jgi:nucleoside-diphosphate-sugar epimerase
MQKPTTLVVGGAGYIGSHMVLGLLRYENIRDIIASAWHWHRKEACL